MIGSVGQDRANQPEPEPFRSSRLLYALYGGLFGALMGLALAAWLDVWFLRCTVAGSLVGFVSGLTLGSRAIDWLHALSEWLGG